MSISPLSWRWTQGNTTGRRNLLQLNTVSSDEGLMSNTSTPAHPAENIHITDHSLENRLLSDLTKKKKT